MATVKSFTDLQQSRKLAEILPLESADMIYIMYHNGEKPQNGDANLSTVFESSEHRWYWIDIIDESWDIHIGEDIPCWSLAALLGVLEHPRCFQGDKPIYWFCGCFGKNNLYHEVEADNPVDACYKMIIELHKLNLL